MELEVESISTSIFYPSLLGSGDPLEDISDRYGVPIEQIKVIYDKFDRMIAKFQEEMDDIFSRLDKLEKSNKLITVSVNK